MKIRFLARFSIAACEKSPDDIFVFGDNLIQKGKAAGAGQAVIRDQPNAHGIPTKRLPSTAANAYFSDQPDEIEAMVKALRELYKLGKNKTLVFPKDGLGTGRAKMAEKSPKAFAQMNEILKAHFGVDFTDSSSPTLEEPAA
ncbi:DUF7831 domain-containing protein [Pseudomonas aeruginosa]